MSRLFRLILIIGYLYPSLSRSQSLMDWSGPVVPKHNFKGQVKQITQVQSPVKNPDGDWFEGPSGQNYSEEYTKEGFLLKRIARDDYNKPTLAIHCEYNSKGQVSGLCTEALDMRPHWGPSTGRIDFDYKPARNGYIMRDTRLVMGKPHNERIETEIDSLNRISTKRKYEQDTILVSEQRHKWDIHGNTTEDASRYRYRSDSQFPSRDTSRTNSIRNRFSIGLSEADKTLIDSLKKQQPEWTSHTATYKNEYDSQTRLVRQETYTNNQMTEIISYSYNQGATKVLRQFYDTRGNLISESTGHKAPGVSYIISDSRRHKNGDRWEETTSTSSASYTQPIYQYKYDDHGNWTEQKQVDANGNQIGVALLRTIEYYP